MARAIAPASPAHTSGAAELQQPVVRSPPTPLAGCVGRAVPTAWGEPPPPPHLTHGTAPIAWGELLPPPPPARPATSPSCLPPCLFLPQSHMCSPHYQIAYNGVAHQHGDGRLHRRWM